MWSVFYFALSNPLLSKQKKKEAPDGTSFFLAESKGIPTRLYCLPRRQEFSKNNRHLRDGRKTLHRSVFYFALSNPLLSKQKKKEAPDGTSFFLAESKGIPTRLYCLPRRQEFSKNNRHLRDGRKTLHRSVFSFALSNPLLS